MVAEQDENLFGDKRTIQIKNTVASSASNAEPTVFTREHSIS